MSPSEEYRVMPLRPEYRADWERLFASEAQGAVAEGLLQLPQELLAESLAEQQMGKKEGVFATRDPARTIGRDASARHDAMQMGMQMQVLTPRMEYREETVGSALESGIGGRFQQCLSGGTEQDVVNGSGILKC